MTLNIKPIRNYPFRGKIYTAKQIDEILNGAVLSDYYTKTETDTKLADKQDKLTAGDNIAISDENVISCTTPPLTAGHGITIENNEISLSPEWESYEIPNDGLTDSSYEYILKVKVEQYSNIFAYFYLPFIKDDVMQNSYSNAIRIMSYADGLFYEKLYSCSYYKNKKIIDLYFNYKGIGGVGGTAQTSGTFKCETIDGTPIDSTTIDTYIDVTNNNRALKPFIVKDSNNNARLVCTGQTSISILTGVFAITTVNMGYVRNSVINNTSVTCFSYQMYAQYTDYPTDRIVACYRRKKNPEIPIITPTPNE